MYLFSCTELVNSTYVRIRMNQSITLGFIKPVLSLSSRTGLAQRLLRSNKLSLKVTCTPPLVGSNRGLCPAHFCPLCLKKPRDVLLVV